MPPRPLLDIFRTGYICQSCVASLGPSTCKPRLPRFYRATRRQRPHSSQAAPRPSDSYSAGSTQQPAHVQSKPDDVVIRYWNEEGPGQYRQLRDNEEFNRVSSGMDEAETLFQDMEKQMMKTKEMLEQLQELADLEPEGGKLHGRVKELKVAWHRGLRSHLHAAGGNGAELSEHWDSLPVVASEGFSNVAKREIDEFNRFIRMLEMDGDGVLKLKPGDLKKCWKVYSKARHHLRQDWQAVPREMWELLWSLLSVDAAENENRMPHIFAVATDMVKAGMTLRPEQHVLALEAMFIAGFEKQAIEGWKKALPGAEANLDHARRLWELGLRMCSQHGQLELARFALEQLLASKVDFDKRAIYPYIRALALERDKQDEAWKAYRQLRDLLGDDMTIEHYDEIVHAFLATNNVQLGLHAFVDMMFGGAVDSRGCNSLPSNIANKFFMGKWLKRIIGKGDLEGAYRVLRFAQANGITVASTQVNGLIGAWLRTETVQNVEKAEKLAWAMIQCRLIFVDARSRGEDETSVFRKIPTLDSTGISLGLENEADELIWLPRATSETFALLAENYRTRSLWDNLRKLWTVFQRSEMQADSFMMNQLMKACLASGEASKATEIYNEMMAQTGMIPDAHTFEILLQSLSVNRLYKGFRLDLEHDVANARRIFSDMVGRDFDMTEVSRDLLAAAVLHTFRKLRDFAGMLVAAKAMHELMNFSASQQLMLELLIGTPLLRSPASRHKAKTIQQAQILGHMFERRMRELEQRGIPLDGLTDEQKEVEHHAILQDVIRRLATRKQAQQTALSKQDVVRVAGEMGLHDIVVERDPERIAKLKKRLSKPGWAS